MLQAKMNLHNNLVLVLILHGKENQKLDQRYALLTAIIEVLAIYQLVYVNVMSFSQDTIAAMYKHSSLLNLTQKLFQEATLYLKIIKSSFLNCFQTKSRITNSVLQHLMEAQKCLQLLQILMKQQITTQQYYKYTRINPTLKIIQLYYTQTILIVSLELIFNAHQKINKQQQINVTF
ncbi:transmembrane protein, putative (macronuclear) [Tetrahymena thermophila SB210]|uniref:Transmembrane protein, putative n=1 Tax=Tetrahymena thermophila (strain SB210) TaxID=312017 RepID=W7XEV6_TETTS|nr:transmembrane protein, putative [Tetrahymena thermophila SB210]EWS75288.1 transmembrane protein, putative [Tetrahymena thermophila SB210]|eukprot:XP_012652279.1 transmembrane protein, putative [Tetrahymena thermophila SB210]